MFMPNRRNFNILITKNIFIHKAAIIKVIFKKWPNADPSRSGCVITALPLAVSYIGMYRWCGQELMAYLVLVILQYGKLMPKRTA
jgi:hypothetical protein